MPSSAARAWTACSATPATTGWPAVQAGATDRLIGIEGAVGSDLDDRLDGNAGANILRGGDGADLLRGGHGRDTLSGGTGPDRFIYGSVADSPSPGNGDLVLDFTWSSRGFVDRLDLSAIDARAATTTVNEAFSFIETAAFTDAGQVRWRPLADGAVVEANTGGSLAPDLTIELRNTFTVDADSFLL
jgi:Ca2+-binding RTX toxin-like protein